MLCVAREIGRTELIWAWITASWACSQVLFLPISLLWLTMLKIHPEQHDKQQPHPLPLELVEDEGENEDERRRSFIFRGHTRWFLLINSNVRKNKPVLIWPIILYFIWFFEWGKGVMEERIWGQQCCVMCMGEGDMESQWSQPLAAAREKINTPPLAYLHKGLTQTLISYYGTRDRSPPPLFLPPSSSLMLSSSLSHILTPDLSLSDMRLLRWDKWK